MPDTTKQALDAIRRARARIEYLRTYAFTGTREACGEIDTAITALEADQAQAAPAPGTHLMLTAAQLREALEFFGGEEGDADDPVKVCIGPRDDGRDADDQPAPRGLYVWLQDYPEEGAMPLDGKAQAAQAVPGSRLSPFDAVARAMDLASLMGGAIGMSDVEKTEAYKARLRAHLIEYIYPQAAQAVPSTLPERDPVLTDKCQGLFRKFEVRRTDGKDLPGERHHGCEYFVLDVTHDPHAKAALRAYADACEPTHSFLAADMRDRYQLAAQAVPAEPFGYLTRHRAEVAEAIRLDLDQDPGYLWRYTHGTKDLQAFARCADLEVLPLYTAPQPVAVQQWLPIETAPKNGSLFLCWVAAVSYGETDEGQQYQEDVSQVDFCHWQDHPDAPDGGWFEPCCGQIADGQDVTHWMPLPAAPGAAAPKEQDHG